MKTFKQFLAESASSKWTDEIRFIMPHAKRTVSSMITNGTKNLYVNFFNGKVRVENGEGKLYRNMLFTTKDKFARDVAQILHAKGFRWKDAVQRDDFNPEEFFKEDTDDLLEFGPGSGDQRNMRGSTRPSHDDHDDDDDDDDDDDGRKYLKLNGRKVEVDEIGGVDPKDYPDFTDAYFQSAHFVDTGEDLTDAQLEKLADLYPEVVHELAYDSLH